MSPNPVDIDQAAERLKSVSSTDMMRAKARQRLDQPRRAGFPKLALVALTAGVAAFFLWPRGSSGVAWAQALNASGQARRVHYVVRNMKGETVSEEWTEGKKYAHVIYSKTGKVYHEWRSDGIRIYNYFDFFANTDAPKNPNREDYGTLYLVRAQLAIPGILNMGGHLDELIKFRKGTILRQVSTSTQSGPAVKYDLKFAAPFLDECSATVDDRTGLIVEIEHKDSAIATIDYPESFPSEIFEPKPQVVKSVKIYDLEKQKSEIASSLKRGLAKANGVTLRLVAIDNAGALWAIWSGSPVSHRMERPFTAAGVKLGPAFGLRQFTTSASAKDAPATTADGVRLYGMARLAFTKVGDYVDLSIPTRNGIVSFKHVPVMRIGIPQLYVPWGG